MSIAPRPESAPHPSRRRRARRPGQSAWLRALLAAIALFSVLSGLLPHTAPQTADADVLAGPQGDVAEQSFSGLATLTVLSTPVEVQRSSGSRETATSGITIAIGDRIFTGSTGYALITFFQGTEVEIEENSEIMLQQAEQRSNGSSQVGIGQSAGNTVTRVVQLTNPNSKVQVNTPSAVAVVRGTTLTSRVLPNGVQVFTCEDGRCQVTTNGGTQTLQHGQSLVVPPPQPTPTGTPQRGNSNNAGQNDPPPSTPIITSDLDKVLATVNATVTPLAPAVGTSTPTPTPQGLVTATGTPGTPVGTATRTPAVPSRTPTTAAATATSTSVPATLTPTPGSQEEPAPVPDTTVSTNTPTPTPTPTMTPTTTLTPTSTPTASLTPTASPTPTMTPTATVSVPTPTLGTGQARISGKVTNVSNTPIAGASVNTHPNAVYSSSDTSGAYNMAVNTGSYDMLVTGASGYTQKQIPRVNATSSGSAYSQDIVLQSNDTIISGTAFDGNSAAGVANPSISFGVDNTDTTPSAFSVLSTTGSGLGTYSVSAASGSYSYAMAVVNGGTGYSYRQDSISGVSASPGSSTTNFYLPTFSVVSGTCGTNDATCTMTVSGSSWYPNQSVYVELVSGGTPSTVGYATADSSGNLSNASVTFYSRPTTTGTLTVQAYASNAGYNSKVAKTTSTYTVSALSALAITSSAPYHTVALSPSSTNGCTAMVNFNWTTNRSATSQVEYGTTSGSYSTTYPVSDSSADSTSHAVSLTLSATSALPQTYYYRVVSSDLATPTPDTIRSAEGSFSFAACP